MDLKRFVAGRELQPGTLWVAEQIPGLIEAADMTETLMRGYWPSYNVPFFPEVQGTSGLCALTGWCARWLPAVASCRWTCILAWNACAVIPGLCVLRVNAAQRSTGASATAETLTSIRLDFPS